MFCADFFGARDEFLRTTAGALVSCDHKAQFRPTGSTAYTVPVCLLAVRRCRAGRDDFWTEGLELGSCSAVALELFCT